MAGAVRRWTRRLAAALVALIAQELSENETFGIGSGTHDALDDHQWRVCRGHVTATTPEPVAVRRNDGVHAAGSRAAAHPVD